MLKTTRKRHILARRLWEHRLLLLYLWAFPRSVFGQGPVSAEELPYSFADLAPCGLSTTELVALNRTTPIGPCILYDTRPEPIPNHQQNRTTTVTVVGVFKSGADIHRDGGLIAAQKLNQDNQGRGAAIGYYKDHFIQIRLVVGIAGNREQMGPEQYMKAHGTLLQVLLEDLKPQYIMGTSSFDSENEREFAGYYRTMLVAQVGPQSYYTSDRSNDHVFGAHIPSEGYGIPAFQALRFAKEVSPETQKIRVVYRDRSEFFYSTCRAVYDRAVDEGYNLTAGIEYNPDADDDDNGLLNHEDPDFLRGLADQVCSPNEAFDNIAVWGCFLTDTEVNTFLERLRENRCRLSSLWLTVASWAWPNQFPEAVPYIQSGGQWHASMQYGDEYFDNGQEMLDQMAQQFGYIPSYGALGAYHAIYIMFANIRSFFKGKNEPAVEATFSSPEGYEELRRAMLDLSLPHSIYGPTAFDENGRNSGRGSAGMQWNTPTVNNHHTPNNNQHKDISHEGYELLLVSPLDQATSAVVFPAPSSDECPSGSFVNQSQIVQSSSILTNKCDLCPAGTFQENTNSDTSCQACAPGSSTDGQEGSSICLELEDNLVPTGLHVFGYLIVSIVYGLALGFAFWTVRHRNDPIVRIGQLEFLLMLCLGPIISSSSIIALSFQAGSLEDETAASSACTALPWLYTTGWMLQYGSLSAKSYRMYSTMRAAESVQGRTVSAVDTYKILAFLLLLNWSIVIPWTILDPLVWERHDQGTIVDQELGVLTYESYGRCNSSHLAWWAGATLALHFVVMIATNSLLYQIRNVSDRYQESKYVAMASLYACEFLVVGIPILIAVGENAVEASYIVFVCVIGLSDMGILLMIFVPKIRFIQKGLPEGVSVGQSIFKKNAPGQQRSPLAPQNTSSNNELMGEQSMQRAKEESMQRANEEEAETMSAPKSNRSRNSSLPADTPNASLSEMVLQGVNAEPIADTTENEEQNLKKQEEGALMNCMTLQW